MGVVRFFLASHRLFFPVVPFPHRFFIAFPSAFSLRTIACSRVTLCLASPSRCDTEMHFEMLLRINTRKEPSTTANDKMDSTAGGKGIETT
jgi:hypothetical protein